MNKLEDQYNNTYHHSINKKPIDADYSVSSEKTVLKLLRLKLTIESELLSIRIFLVKVSLNTKYKNIFSKGYTENWWREIFTINSALETKPWTCKSKD